MRRALNLAAAVLATLLAVPTTADAAQRKVPFGFFGSVMPPVLRVVDLSTDEGDRRFRKIPKVLETPKRKDLREDVINLKTLRRLMTNAPRNKPIN